VEFTSDNSQIPDMTKPAFAGFFNSVVLFLPLIVLILYGLSGFLVIIFRRNLLIYPLALLVILYREFLISYTMNIAGSMPN